MLWFVFCSFKPHVKIFILSPLLQNLLFADKSENAQLKLVDFGFAKIKGSQPMQTPCFTLSYAAPEILKNATGENKPSSYDESVDIWSLGVILVSGAGASLESTYVIMSITINPLTPLCPC